MVEHPAVNRRVVGSNPTRGAILKTKITFSLFLFMPYFVYILYSNSADTYYIGSSNNPERRLSFHNTIEKGFTSRYRPWQIAFKKEFSTKAEAQQSEQKLKQWKSKLMIQCLIMVKSIYDIRLLSRLRLGVGM
jgi:putative endonuclease